MSDLKDKNIISKYLMYVDKNYNKLRGNANFYEASESLRIHIDDEMFLIVDSWDFIRELNEWLNDNYAKELCDETRYELPEDIRDREYFIAWLDYLTDGMWGFSDEYSVCEHCNKAFRTSPDSYSWVANYWVGDGFILCEDCVRENYSEEYLESLEEKCPPEFLYHGTGEKYIESIDKIGLIPKSRLYVHLSKDIATAEQVGKRHGKEIVYKVNAGQMYKDGYKFFLSVNNVWLTKEVPVKYLNR